MGLGAGTIFGFKYGKLRQRRECLALSYISRCGRWGAGALGGAGGQGQVHLRGCWICGVRGDGCLSMEAWGFW